MPGIGDRRKTIQISLAQSVRATPPALPRETPSSLSPSRSREPHSSACVRAYGRAVCPIVAVSRTSYTMACGGRARETELLRVRGSVVSRAFTLGPPRFGSRPRRCATIERTSGLIGASRKLPKTASSPPYAASSLRVRSVRRIKGDIIIIDDLLPFGRSILIVSLFFRGSGHFRVHFFSPNFSSFKLFIPA